MDRYYEEELRYLQEAGQEFGEKHPERAGFLRLDSKDRDPYVERLLEGFAFISGRIRERLDDDYPEFTRGLLDVLFPQMLRPVPSMTMLQFLPRRAALQSTQMIPRGTSAFSTPVGREGVSCRFTTAADVRLHPISLEEARLDRTLRGRHLFRLRFALDRGVDAQALRLDPLTLFLHGEPSLTTTLYLYLTRHVERVVVKGAPGQVTEVPGEDPIRPAGFGEGEALLPYETRSLAGLRYLQEYFAFRDRFLTVELHGGPALRLPAGSTGFEIEIHLAEDYPEEKRFGAGNFRLHCAPAVNLFLADTEPITVERETLEYTVTADARYPTAIEIWAVESVEGLSEDKRRTYRRLYELDPPGVARAAEGSYAIGQRMGAMGRWHTTLRLDRLPSAALERAPESLSIRAWCTHGQHPRDLAEGSVSVPGPDFPEYAQFTNLTRPTPPAYPPIGKELEWRLMSHLALNQRALDSAAALQGLLELYDWSGTPANRRRLQGLRTLTAIPEERLMGGALLRGTRLSLEIAEDHFLDRADAYLFGVVLSRFFRLYATLNTFVHVTLDLIPSGDRYEWTPMPGQVTLI